ncbi:hypothetical protein [Clostridium sp.]|uniref:hypothetical protein n=1 Tax=Clostridium sp. TaxID=1506 RepID=UPI0039955F9C
MKIQDTRELKNLVIELIDKMEVITESDIYKILKINEIKPNKIVPYDMAKQLRNSENKELFSIAMKTIESKNRYSMDFVKIDNTYISNLATKKIKDHIDDYKKFIDFFAAIATTTEIENISDISVLSENEIIFTHINNKTINLENVKLIHYRRGMREDIMLSESDIKNKVKCIIILIDDEDLEFYKDISIPLDIKSFVYFKVDNTYLMGANINALKSRIEEKAN